MLLASCADQSGDTSGLFNAGQSGGQQQSGPSDSTAPTLLSTNINANTYGSSDTINIVVQFDEVVLVNGNPRIEIIMESQSSSNLYANYSSGSGSATLTFSYNVSAGDGDSDGITLASNIDLNFATIRDAAANNATINLTATNFASVLVDSQAPMINSFIEPANGTYADGGGELLFQVNFTEAVTITGTPRIPINLGGSTVYATYQSGSGTAGLEFSYAIQSGDNDSDGVTLLGTSIDPNGGTVRAVADSDNAALGFSAYLDSMAAVLVDTSSGIIAPDQVTGVSTAPTTVNTELSVSWAIPNDNSTAIIDYTVQYREQGQSTWNTVSPKPTSNIATITGLSAGITYEIRVAANNGLLGSYSSISTAEIFDVMSLNPIAWLSATDISNGGSEPNNGDKVDSWSDLTGVASDATESNPSLQPEYQTNVQNGLPAVYFDGTHSRGLEGSFTRLNNSGLTVFLVGKMDSVTPRRCFFEFYSTTITRRGFFFTYGFNEASTNRGLDDSGFNVWSAYDDGSKTDLWENGTSMYTDINNWGATAFTGSGAYVLGDDQTGGDEFKGYIGEFLIFDRQLTPTERSQVETYLKNKWGTP
jgi:hypothetical protein